MDNNPNQERLEREDSWSGMVVNRHLEGVAKAQGFLWKSIKFNYRGNDWLVIATRITTDSREEVSFCNGKTMGSAVRTLYSLAQQEKLKWRKPKVWN